MPKVSVRPGRTLQVSPKYQPVWVPRRCSTSPLFWVKKENAPSMKSARSKPSSLPKDVAWPSNWNWPELWNRVLLLKRLRTMLMPHTRLWFPFDLVQSCSSSRLPRPKRMACSGALNDTPLPTMLMSMWLPFAFRSTPRPAVVSGKSVAMLASWCAAVNWVWTTVVGFMTQVCPSVALRLSRKPEYRAA